MTHLYDEAIINNLKSVTGDNRISIQPADRVFQNIAKKEYDKIEFPLISIFRTGWSLLGSRSFYMLHEGALVKIEESEEKNVDPKFYRVQNIPIRINYSMDVWTKTREENDNIIRELLFYYMTNPTMTITIPYGLNIVHDFNIFFNDDIEDNSDVSDHFNRGEYFRQTLSFYTDDAYLWKATSRGPTIIDPDFIDLVSIDKSKLQQ